MRLLGVCDIWCAPSLRAPTVVCGATYSLHMTVGALKLMSTWTFHSHLDHIIDKTKHALHGLIKLGKAGVRSHSLVLFYKARILSVLSYAAPCWFPHTSQNDKVKLERFQKLCTRIMIPYEEEYEERLSFLKSKSWIYILIFCVWTMLQRLVIMTIIHARNFWKTKITVQ